MNKYLLYFAGFLSAIVATQAHADHCGVQAFRLTQHAYVAPLKFNAVQAYVQPVVVPLQQYSYNAPAQAVILPAKVQVTRPAITLQLEQVQGYNYAAPLQFNAGYNLQLNSGHHVQQFNAGHNLQFNQRHNNLQFRQNFNQHNRQNFQDHNRQNLGQRNNGGILGRIQDNIQARRADRQEFRQNQQLDRARFSLQLRGK